MVRRKSLLIRINYAGSENQLAGCHQDVENVAEFIKYRGYSDNPTDQVILRCDLEDPYYPTGHNILAAIDWLVSEPDTTCFFHYSGHGGQVDDPSGRHPSGVLDTVVPIDYQELGQIDADTLHEHLVSRLSSDSSLFAVLDCCHSGSTLELPFVYRSDDDGNVKQLDSFHEGIKLMTEATNRLFSGFRYDKNQQQALDRYAGATSFFRSLRREHGQRGLVEDEYASDWSREHKTVTMFSGCRDDETSADAEVDGVKEGAMTWAFLKTFEKHPNPTYVQALQETRALLKSSEYTQVPQLCVGVNMDLDRPLIL